MVNDSSAVKQKGFLLFEVLVMALLIQILTFYCLPSYKQLYQRIAAVTYLNTIRFNIEWVRWQALLTHKKLQMRPYQNQWSKGWLILDDNEIIRVTKPLLPPLNVSWHGFKQYVLNFYPDMTKNHVNGYFQVMNIRLVLNRYGHSRISYEL